MIDPIPAHWEGPRRIAELELRIAAAMDAHGYLCGCAGAPPHCDLYAALTGDTA